MNLKFLVFSIGLILFTSITYGQVVVDSYTSEIYFVDENEKTIDISFRCLNESLQVVDAYVQFANFQREKAYFNGVSFFRTLDVFNISVIYGKQPLRAICVYNDSSEEIAEVYVNVYQVSFSIAHPTPLDKLTAYIGEFFYDVKLKAELNGVPSSESLQNLKLYVSNETTSKFLENLYYYVDGSGSLVVMGKVPYGLQEGIYDLKAEAYYVNGSASLGLTAIQPSSMELKFPLKVDLMAPSGDVDLKTSEQIALSFKFYEKDVLSRDLTKDNVRIYLDNEEIAIDEFAREDDTYTLKITLIKPLDITDYKKQLFLEVHNYKHYPSFKFKLFDVFYVVKVKGSSITKDGKIIDTSIYFFGQRIQRYVKSSSTGEYELYLPPGLYDIEIKIPETYAKYEDVEIKENVDDLLRVSWLNPKMRFNVAKGLYMELLLPSSSNYVKIYYPDRYVYNEKNLAVFYCESWDFLNDKCKGKLEDITSEANINIISNYVEIWNRSGAFLIGEKMYAVIDASVEKQNYFVGDLVIVSGSVRNLKGEGLEGVDVYYEIEGYDIKGKVVSEEKGSFEISFPAPLPKGNKKVTALKIKLYTKDEDINNLPVELVFNVEKRAKLAVQVEDVIKVKAGEKKTIPILVLNDGDLLLTDIEFRVEGLKTDWYTITPALIETLEPGESKQVNFVVDIPADYCHGLPENMCKEYYFVNMRVKSEETREDVSFTLRVETSEENSTISQEKVVAQEKSRESFSLTKYTGKVVSNLSNINAWLIIGFFIAAFIIITLKKKKRAIRRPFRRANFYKSLK